MAPTKPTKRKRPTEEDDEESVASEGEYASLPVQADDVESSDDDAGAKHRRKKTGKGGFAVFGGFEND
jgi:hypothetical protein